MTESESSFVVEVVGHESVPEDAGTICLLLRNPDASVTRLTMPRDTYVPKVGEAITVYFTDT